LPREIRQRCRDICRPTENRHLRHNEDKTGLFVLGKSASAGLLHLQHAVGTIVTHSGHDRANAVAASTARHRSRHYGHEWGDVIDDANLAGDRADRTRRIGNGLAALFRILRRLSRDAVGARADSEFCAIEAERPV
jgi:hypothetical protein